MWAISLCGVGNLAGEPGQKADHSLGREQGTSDVCEEQRKMSMGSDLHGKNGSINADDVTGLKFEGCSSSVRPMKETQSIPVCLDEVERANADGVKTAFPPAVSEPEQVKPVEVVGEGGVTMAAEEGGKGSEGLDHLSMVEEVHVAMASPLVCEGSIDKEEDVEWGGSGGDLRLHKGRCLVEGEKASVSGDIGVKARAAEGVNEECAHIEKVEDENVSGSPGEFGQPVLPKLSDQAAKQLGITVKESLPSHLPNSCFHWLMKRPLQCRQR